MAWCFSTRTSVVTMLTKHPCVSRCLSVNPSLARQNGFNFPGDIFKCIFVNKSFVFWSDVHRSLFPRVQTTKSQHWFSCSTPSHLLNQADPVRDYLFWPKFTKFSVLCAASYYTHIPWYIESRASIVHLLFAWAHPISGSAYRYDIKYHKQNIYPQNN